MMIVGFFGLNLNVNYSCGFEGSGSIGWVILALLSDSMLMNDLGAM